MDSFARTACITWLGMDVGYVRDQERPPGGNPLSGKSIGCGLYLSLWLSGTTNSFTWLSGVSDCALHWVRPTQSLLFLGRVADQSPDKTVRLMLVASFVIGQSQRLYFTVKSPDDWSFQLYSEVQWGGWPGFLPRRVTDPAPSQANSLVGDLSCAL